MMSLQKVFKVQDRVFDYLNPFVIAEIGVNHEGNMHRAHRMIDAIADAGGHCAKFQTYKADLLATKSTSPAYWDKTKEPTPSQHDLFQRWDTFGPDEYSALAKHCIARGIVFMSTPFDLEAVDMLAHLMPVIKVASADLTNVPLLRKVARTGLPVILSVGASRPDEIGSAIDYLRIAGASDVTLLHCVLNYPTPPHAAELNQIDALFDLFGHQCAIGYSDHVPPLENGRMPALEFATIRGSVVLEKHFTDDKKARGNDHYHAMDGADLAKFMDDVRLYRILGGNSPFALSGQQAAIDNARRRIVAQHDLASGSTVTENDLIALRSNIGIEIAHWDTVVGATLARPVTAGLPLEWKDIV
jgi:N-acetylneuraminate synthase